MSIFVKITLCGFQTKNETWSEWCTWHPLKAQSPQKRFLIHMKRSKALNYINHKWSVKVNYVQIILEYSCAVDHNYKLFQKSLPSLQTYFSPWKKSKWLLQRSSTIFLISRHIKVLKSMIWLLGFRPKWMQATNHFIHDCPFFQSGPSSSILHSFRS